MSSTDLAATLSAAIAGGYLAQSSGQTFTITAPIVINVNSTIEGPLGIDLGGAHIISQITNGAPVIQVNVGPGVDLRYLTFSNFTIDGNGHEGDGIKIVADGNDRWAYNFTVDNVTVKGVGGYGLDVQGSVFEGLVSNSNMIGNAQGGAYFGHSAGGGQVSALRWFGGSLQDNGGAGLVLGNGARDMSVDGVTFAHNNDVGISAESGITSVTNSQFTDNKTAGIWFQNFGNFSGNTFTNSGTQGTGLTGWLNGGAGLTDNTSVFTGSGSDPTVLANLQGYGTAYMEGDVGRTVMGSNVIASGTGAGNTTEVTLSSVGVGVPTLQAITDSTTAAQANSTGTGSLETALRTALNGGTVANLSGATYTVTAPIVINLTQSSPGPIGIDLGGAKILSQITNGQPVIEIIAGPGVNVGALELSNFTLLGNGQEGDGIKIVADGADRLVHLDVERVNVEHVGGIGLDVIGNVKGTVFDSWMHGDLSGGARFANSINGGTADSLQWIGGGFRKNGVAGLILDGGAHDIAVQGAYFVENQGPGIDAAHGITRVAQSGFENNGGVGTLVQGAATFVDDTFSTYGVQQTAIGGYLSGQQITLVGTGNEYYGGGPDNTVLANVQGNGTLSVAGGGKVVASSGIRMTGLADLATLSSASDTTAPTVTSVATSGAGIVAGTGTLGIGKAITLTVTFSEAVSVSGGTPSLQLNDGGTATYTGGSGTASLTFTHTVQSGQNAADLAVAALNLNGAAIADAAGNAAVLAGAASNPPGVLAIDTQAPTVSAITTAGNGIVGGSGTVHTGDTVSFTVIMSEAVTVAGTPTLALSSGGVAAYVGGSGTNTLTFNNVVASGQSSADLVVNSLAGGTLNDTAGNLADRSGATNYNPPGTLKVDTGSTPGTTSPIVTMQLASDTGSSATDRVTWNAALSGTADANALVRFTIDGQATTQTATADAKGGWSFTPGALGDGQHTIVASETNAAGATGSASLTFTLDTTAPSPTFTDVTAANGKVTLSGSSSAGDQLSIYDGMTWLGFATAGSDGRFTFTANAAANVTHNYGMGGTDVAGNTGGGGNRALLGSNAGDKLVGGTGTDVIAGEAGNDTLTGSAGADTFVFDRAPGSSNLDRITDFVSGSDNLVLKHSAFAALPVGNLAPAAFVQAIAALTPDQHLIYNKSTGLLSYDADGSGSGAAVGVVQLTAGQALTAGDIKVT